MASTAWPDDRPRAAGASRYRCDSRPAGFKDTSKASLEDQLPALLRELEIRAREDAHHRLQEEWEAVQKRRRWERAMGQARNDFREAARIEELTRQLEAWRLANDLDQYPLPCVTTSRPSRTKATGRRPRMR